MRKGLRVLERFTQEEKDQMERMLSLKTYLDAIGATLDARGEGVKVTLPPPPWEAEE